MHVQALFREILATYKQRQSTKIASTGLHPWRAPQWVPRCVPNSKSVSQSETLGQANRTSSQRLGVCLTLLSALCPGDSRHPRTVSDCCRHMGPKDTSPSAHQIQGIKRHWEIASKPGTGHNNQGTRCMYKLLSGRY